MNLTAQTVMALMMPSVFLAQCFFHQPLLLYIVQTLAEVGLTVLPPLDNQINFVSMSAWAGSSAFQSSTASPYVSILVLGSHCTPHCI